MGSMKEMKGTCVAYGYFDGVHKGHIEVAKKVVELGKEKGLTSVIVSRAKEGQVLSTEEEKEYLFKGEGVEEVITYSGDEIAEEEFIKDVLVGTLDAKVIVVGATNTNMEKVEEAAKACGVDLVVCDVVKEDGEAITTAQVKEAFDKSDFDQIYKLCGHPYIMIGKVEHGKALGRTVGMPTANLGVADYKLKPPSGVYATSVQIDDEVFKAMTNIGKRPSVDDFDYVTIEAFILDFARDIYGKKIILGVRQFVRGVQKFNNLEEVQQQVQKDIQKVREVLQSVVE